MKHSKVFRWSFSLTILTLLHIPKSFSETVLIEYKKYFIPIVKTSSVRPNDTEETPRVIISTDLGSRGDQDDYQSLVHALLNSNKYQLEGIIGSRPSGEASEIKKVLEAYQLDFRRTNSNNRINVSNGYSELSSSIVRQGARSNFERSSVSASEISSGAEYIITTALSDTAKPLYILAWGSLTDVAQAIQANPNIVPIIRLVSIGSSNSGYRACCREFDRDARDFLFEMHTSNPAEETNLWWVEMETSFRGLYGPDSTIEDYESSVFQHISRRGCLGKIWKDHDRPGVSYPYTQPSNRPFSGDYLSTLYILDSAPKRNNPAAESNSGRYYNDDPSRPFYWTERNQSSRGSQCGEENRVRNRSATSSACWEAGYIYLRAKTTITDDFKRVANRLENNQSYCR